MKWSQLKTRIEEKFAESVVGRVEVWNTRYPREKIFCCERSYRITRPVDEILAACNTGTPSAESDVIKHYKILDEDFNLITLVWKFKSIEPIVHIRREGEFLILTYNFTSLAEVTCGAVLIFLCSTFITNWKSAIFNPGLLFHAGLLFFWIRSIKVAKAVDAYFKRHEISYDNIFDMIQ